METSRADQVGWYRRRGKRIGDVIGASLLSILALPIILATTVGVRAALGRPIFFRQDRAGKDGKSFTLIKFRSMVSEPDASHRALSNEQRLTTFGRFLRRTSLDELPELWNVLRGDMSLVGPRPLLPQYNERYSPEQARRLTVRPGLTGWAQINGRNNATWTRRFECDVWYVDNLSPALDLKILIKTLPAVLLGTGVTPAGDAFMPEFVGEGAGTAVNDSVKT